MTKNHQLSSITLLAAVLVGIVLGLSNVPILFSASSIIADIFLKMLQLVSLPLVFFSILSTLSARKNIGKIAYITKQVASYTFLTTVIAALVGLLLFFIFFPQGVGVTNAPSEYTSTHAAYGQFLLSVIPDNIVAPFLNKNVMGVAFIGMLFGWGSQHLGRRGKIIHVLSDTMFQLILIITRWILQWLPLAILSFTILILRDVRAGSFSYNIVAYAICVVLANCIQGVIVLPLLLKQHAIPIWKMIRPLFKVLSVAFFSKSSSATLPLTMEVVENECGVKKDVSRFVLPLCSIINMNGCAAFILITTLFVSSSHHIVFSAFDMIWLVTISTLAAIGNAGVPMGCYLLTCSLLGSMNIPLHIMGLILPFYSFMDMIETSLNVWSDCSIALMINKKNVTKSSM